VETEESTLLVNAEIALILEPNMRIATSRTKRPDGVNTGLDFSEPLLSK
jgi:hypothetical protein